MANLKFYKEIAELLDIDPASDDSSFVTGIELFGNCDGRIGTILTRFHPHYS
jgi:hypothetical protein